SVEILRKYKTKFPNKILLLPERKNFGIKKSFSLLLEYALGLNTSNYFMFCDQDDVWDSRKVEITLNKMKEMEKNYPNTPILVHTDLEVVDEDLSLISNSFWEYEYLNPKLNSFPRLLMQNTVTGCTMMINRQLAQKALPISNKAIIHDWWIALVASKFGKIAYLPYSTVKYRQHKKNTIGAKGYKNKLFSKKTLHLIGKAIFYKNKKGFYKHHYINLQQAEGFLEQYFEELDLETKEMLFNFSRLDKLSFLEKRKFLLQHNILKQGTIRNLGMLLSI
ncbi:MAG: glycosyltransferase family 2 protein, partial [Epsilonproteobacteria bacterium]|nr:glycosyltransferase family 2 protein [Campylobacterota bacterium]